MSAETIDRFYRAFAARDAETMASCYAPGVRFWDPVFEHLEGDRVAAMWRMLCERGADLSIEHRDVAVDGAHGRAHWEARYTFSTTGRPVHNVVEARFELLDGSIVAHRDEFDFYRWSRQALGPTGLLLGWTPLVRNKVRALAARQLASFMARA